jgi:hypothetical protein
VTAFKLENFGGIRPRVSARLLPNSSAVTAENTKLLEGELRGYHVPSIYQDLSGFGFPVGRAYRIPLSVTQSVGGTADAWLAFESPNTDIIRSPVLNDEFNRYYFFSDSFAPMYNTLARIVAGNTGANAPWLLGVPQPAAGGGSGLTLTATGGSGVEEIRSYVYTFVTAYNEEGPPSNPVTAAEFSNATSWNLAGGSTTWIGGSQVNIAYVNIYRTVPNSSNPAFFFVAQVPIATWIADSGTYSDTSLNINVALNNTLIFVDNFPPIAGIEGAALMPGGFLLGFDGPTRQLYMTEPYLPWAWNPTYTLSTEFEIVGIAIWSQTAIICTTSALYLGSGSTPAAFTLQKLDGVTPCLSRRGIVSTVSGVYFPTVDGLAMFNVSGLITITQPILTKEEWATFSPTTLIAAQLGLQYIAWSSPLNGVQINPTESNAEMATITAFSQVTAVETDRYTGNPYFVSNNVAFQWDPVGAQRLNWHWLSKVVQLPKFLNFGAFKIKADFGSTNVTSAVTATYGPYDLARNITDPGPINGGGGQLNCLGANMLGGQSPYNIGLVPGNTLPENRLPLGGSPLYPLAILNNQGLSIRMRVYCNGIIVSDQNISDDKIHRLPSGFKHDLWQFEFFGNTNMYNVMVAETGKELVAV